jgi:crossover junction endodeoxyribonuclease RusA
MESTSKVVEMNGVPARIWKGVSEKGVPFLAQSVLTSPPGISTKSMRSISFTVYGRPEPKGSMRAFLTRPKVGSGKKPRAVLVPDNGKSLPWMQQIARTAREEMSKQGFDAWDRETAVAVQIVFYLARPKSAPKRRAFPAVKPDVDKLARSALDSITGIVFADDSQVTDLALAKRYGTPERVEIVVAVMSEIEPHWGANGMPLFGDPAALGGFR